MRAARADARAYYNENDAAAAAILRQLIDDGVIAPGDVDDRSIKDVEPDDLDGYTQCHFFAGGGLWSVAARMAGWPDDRPLWTGSCPCQPFSAAGKGLGTDDPRHLWPDLHRLIRARRPAVVVGEQVAGKAGYGWLDGVRADLAGEGYASRGVDFPACSVDAPHQRNRLYWIAVADRCGEGLALGSVADVGRGTVRIEGSPIVSHHDRGRRETDGAKRCDLADRDSGNERWGHRPESGATRCAQGEAQGQIWQRDGFLDHGTDARSLPSDPAVVLLQGQPPARHQSDAGKDKGVLAHGGYARPAFRTQFDGDKNRETGDRHEGANTSRRHDAPLRNGTHWSDAEWIECHDGKTRRAQPGIRFLVDGLPGRVDLWRVGGNAIIPQAAAEVLAAFLEAEIERREAA